jgi:hypothetical protein
MLFNNFQVGRLVLFILTTVFCKSALCQVEIDSLKVGSPNNYLQDLNSWIEWEGTHQFGSYDKKDIDNRRLAITFFIEDQILPVIPEPFRKKLENRQFKFFFTEQCQASAFFYHPLHLMMPIRVCFKPEVFFSQKIFGLVAHEMFHVLHYLMNPKEEEWLKEGLAVWFEYQVTRRFPIDFAKVALTKNRMQFGHSYEHSVTEKEDSELIGKYGHDFLFVYYLQLRYSKGDSSAVWSLVNPGPPGLSTRTNLENFVGNEISFERLVLDFEIARYHNHISFDSQGRPDKTFFITRTPFFVVPELVENSKMEEILAKYQLEVFESVLVGWSDTDVKLEIINSLFDRFTGYRFVWLESVAPYRIYFESDKVAALPKEELEHFNLVIHRTSDVQ